MRLLVWLWLCLPLFAWDIDRVAGLCLGGNDGACEILFANKIPQRVTTLFAHACLSGDVWGCYLAAKATDNEQEALQWYQMCCERESALCCEQSTLLRQTKQ